MAAPTSSLVAVQTYQQSGLGYLQNLNCAISTFNTKFRNFENMTAQRGDTVTFDRPVRYNGASGLVATFEGTTQLVETLTVSEAYNVAFSFDNQDYVFNADKCIDKFHGSATRQLSTVIESNVFENCIMNNTYRTYYAGISGGSTKVMDAINSRTQLSTALARFRNSGAPNGNAKFYMSDLAIPAIIGQDLTAFVPNRNEKLANSWELGSYGGADFYSSNLLPLHKAGTIGNEGETMTVVSINAAGNQLTMNGVTASTATLKAGDIIEFNDNVSGQPNMRFLTYIGHQPSGQNVQVRVTADATADGSGQIIASISPALISDPTNAQRNINNPVAAGMTLKALPNHRAGLIVGGDAAFLALPRLANEDPFPTSSETDPETGVSMRVYFGSKFGQNERGFVVDQIWGSHLVADYAMRVAFPETV